MPWIDQGRIAQPRYFRQSNKLTLVVQATCLQACRSFAIFWLLIIWKVYKPLAVARASSVTCLKWADILGSWFICLYAVMIWPSRRPLFWSWQTFVCDLSEGSTFFGVTGYLPVCRLNPTSKTIFAEFSIYFHAKFLTRYRILHLPLHTGLLTKLLHPTKPTCFSQRHTSQKQFFRQTQHFIANWARLAKNNAFSLKLALKLTSSEHSPSRVSSNTTPINS